jgi:hypothetical protein
MSTIYITAVDVLIRKTMAEPAQKRTRYDAAADCEPHVTRLVFADGAFCAGKRDLLYGLKDKMEEANIT